VSYTAILQAFDRSKNPKLPGKSRIKDHGGWVDLLSFSWATSAGSTISRTLSCVYSDAQNVSRELFDACATGTPFDTMVLKIFRDGDGGSQWIFQQELRQATISSIQSSGGDNSTTQMSIDFVSQVVVYRQQEKKNVDFQDGWSADAE
jgi:type VI protein secretion system component Hcp